MIRNTWIETPAMEPERFPAISRWLSEATPPESGVGWDCIPKGCQHGMVVLARVRDERREARLRSLRDRGVYARGVRGCRCARPPANGWHPSGMTTAIAEVLSDMDAELAALEQRRAKTRALKQGMMQELLTGRTRLI